jgi:hypothetical protein
MNGQLSRDWLHDASAVTGRSLLATRGIEIVQEMASAICLIDDELEIK